MQLLEDYLNSILGRVHPLSPVELPIDQALDHVLVDDLVARFAVPPFSNSGMDGYAFHLDHDLEASPENPVTIAVAGDIAA
ncbi:MAG: molybdopterin molybdenumtransferase MoeA, partial [Trueperella pyogenes]|nr:molybdopterin molybdenumtransferase MoeA [Trueperella pyogenes]